MMSTSALHPTRAAAITAFTSPSRLSGSREFLDQDPVEVFLELAGPKQAYPWVDHPFLEAVGGVHVVGMLTSEIELMGFDRSVADQRIVEKSGNHDRHVLWVGTGDEPVGVDEHVSGAQRVLATDAGHAGTDAVIEGSHPQGERFALGETTNLSIVDGRAEIDDLENDRRERGTDQRESASIRPRTPTSGEPPP